ncbi:ABC transporter substrate-binding protein [Rubrobacter tropicus]|uniref:ABC transporter substrate-binding protein n=1 Tax=Rubrobacter tropicus TaxID=2653851 RepID=UPI001D18C4F9|nr:ABC transporter substrate-binding protein [Rubrobacter tropicus]
MATGAGTRRDGEGVRGGDKLSRQEFLRLTGVGLAGATLLGGAGCGRGGERGGEQRIVFSHGPDDTGVLEKQIARFNRQHEGGIQVEWRQMPADGTAHFNELLTELQAGGGNIDVMSGDVIWPAQFAANGWIEDLSDRFPESERRRFLQGPIEANTYDGKLYGVPWYTDAGLLYYRKDLLENSGFAGPPKTWNELKEQASKTMADSRIKNGFVFQGANYEGGVVSGLEFIWNAGGDVLDRSDPGRVVIDNPDSVAGLGAYRGLVEDGVSPEGVSIYTGDETDGIFLRGEAIFHREWPYMYGLLSDPATSEVRPGQVGIAKLPVSVEGLTSYTGLGGWNLFINSASEKVDAAWTFIEFLSAPEQQKERALEATRLPAIAELYEDEEILDKVPVIALGSEAIQSSRPRPVSPYYSDMSLEMAEQFNACLKGEVSPQEAVGTLQEQLQNIADQAS